MELARRGVHVVFTFLNHEQLSLQLVAEAAQLGGSAEGHSVDSRDSQAISSFIKMLINRYGSIDILVNNSGIKHDVPLLMMKEQDWNNVVNTNLNSVFHFSKQVSFYMLKQKKGRIINISSISGIYGLAGQTNYSATKAGIIGFSRALAKELAPYEIPVNVIAPGGVDTEMTQQMKDSGRNELLAAIPAKRFGRPDEVANVAAYLSLDSPAYLTGGVLVLDGGMGIG
ncbi:SDR family oxidoreductase [Paenibacillus sp. FSL K6-1096]|uniref:SDR family oxidoreductase n=1 Tax=Paenibacillus sp. FSL K6-1096 TaxID=2921460 RepID=UPI0030EC3113